MESPKIKLVVGELSFMLYERPLHPELFNIYAKRHLKTEQYETTIWATGCCHVVSVSTKDLCLTELIAVPDQPLPKNGLLEIFKFSGQKNHKCTLAKGFNYMTDFQVERMSPNVYRQSHLDLNNFSRNRGLFVRFPKQAVDGLEPFSYVDFEARKDELHVHIFHGYPEQKTIIKTQSLFDFH